MDEILKQMALAMEQAQLVVSNVEIDQDTPEFVRDILDKTGKDEAEGVSLLLLKNQVVLGYVSNAVLAVLEHLQRLDGAAYDAAPVERTVVQRVAMEKGVRPLEKKLAYQLDKMLRTYTREHQRVVERQQRAQDAAGADSATGKGSDVNSGAGSDGDSDGSDADSESEDELNFKPDTSAASGAGKTKSDGKPETGKYRPPKLAAAALPTTDSGIDDANEPKTKKLQSMEEYLREQLDAPLVEALIGLTIVDHGRGGVKTAHDKRREQEIQDYEEANFTRLPEKKTQKSKHHQRRDQMHTFGGEDFSIFNNDRLMLEGTLRKRKAMSAWDRAKRRK